MILLFLLAIYARDFFWIAPDGRIEAIYPQAYKEHSGFICREAKLSNYEEYMYDLVNEKFIKKPLLAVSLKGDTLKILSTNTKVKTIIEVTEKFIKDIKPTDLRTVKYEISSLSAINVKQDFEKTIRVYNRLTYPEARYLE